MTTASDIISRAYRESNYRAIGDTPSADEQTEGLALLQSIVDSLFAMVAGIKPMMWYVPRPQLTAPTAANYPALPGDAGILLHNDVKYPPANSRLLMKNTDATTVYFQYQPQDGALMEYVDVGHTGTVTLAGNGALFSTTGFDGEVVIPSNNPDARNAPRRWVYRGDYGSWVEIETLTLDSDMPFPTAFDDYFVTGLSIRLSPSMGMDPRQITMIRHQQMTDQIRLQYLQMKEVLVGNAGLPTEHNYWNGRLGSAQAFESG